MTRAVPWSVILYLAAACGPAVQAPPVTPEDIPNLEAQRLVRPRDPQLLAELGVAYYRAGDYAEAARLLSPVGAVPSENFIAALYLALAYEGLAQYDSARVIYSQLQYSEALEDHQREEIADRLLVLTRLELQAQAARAVEQESTLSTVPPLENTVAVFPWRYVGSDENLRPLERGITHLMITDLSQVSQLRLLERARVQALVDEMQLTEAGRVDPRTGARSGRLLRAAVVIQGSLQESPSNANEIRLEAAAVRTTTGVVAGTGAADDQLERLFDLEKAVVLQLIADLGITLTPAERQAIEERPTADLQAFLAFSRGLVREDAGLHREAAEAFGAAARLDPAFQSAVMRHGRAERLALVDELPGDRLSADLRTATDRARRRAQTRITLLSSVHRTNPSRGGRIERRIRMGVPDKRRGLQEVLLQDDPRDLGRIGDIIIVIPRP